MQSVEVETLAVCILFALMPLRKVRIHFSTQQWVNSKAVGAL